MLCYHQLCCMLPRRFYALKHGNSIFFAEGPAGTPLAWSRDEELWERWRDGRTGLPLVDANMRELAATGFMSNRCAAGGRGAGVQAGADGQPLRGPGGATTGMRGDAR
jgi:hypothetical protein